MYDVSLPLARELVVDVKGWAKAATPNDRIYDTFRFIIPRTGMSLLDRDRNLIKKNIFMEYFQETY
jgi:hypothetical protein